VNLEKRDLNINWQYSQAGQTPLFAACGKGHVGVVKYLLSLKGIDPNKPANDGATPFFMSCQEGHKEVVSVMLADQRIDLNKPKNDGTTPFYLACLNGRMEMVSQLLAYPRIDPNKPNNDQGTPLWVASHNGHLVVVQHLLALGREIDTRLRNTYNSKTAAEQGRAMRIAPKGDQETEEGYQRRKTNGPLCADLIDAYEKDPANIRSQMRMQLGLPSNPFLFFFHISLSILIYFRCSSCPLSCKAFPIHAW